MLVVTLETRTTGRKTENCDRLDSSAEEGQTHSKISARISQLPAQPWELCPVLGSPVQER